MARSRCLAIRFPPAQSWWCSSPFSDRYQARLRALVGGPLHHGGVLVYSLDLVCKSCRCDCAIDDQHLAGIRPADLPGFVSAELCGAVVGLLVVNWLLRGGNEGVPMPKEA